MRPTIRIEEENEVNREETTAMVIAARAVALTWGTERRDCAVIDFHALRMRCLAILEPTSSLLKVCPTPPDQRGPGVNQRGPTTTWVAGPL